MTADTTQCIVFNPMEDQIGEMGAIYIILL